MTYRIAAAFAAGLLVHITAASADCVSVALLDDAGDVIKPDGLVVGVMVGDAPVFASALPPHRDQRVIGSVECSPDVMKPVLDLYNLSCRSEQSMRQTAVNYSTPYAAVQQRCADLRQALQ